jgi:hypothetical protein
MTLQNDRPVEISETKASGGIKLGSVRYVLAISLMLAGVAGVIIWNCTGAYGVCLAQRQP